MEDIAWKQILIIGGIGLAVGILAGSLCCCADDPENEGQEGREE